MEFVGLLGLVLIEPMLSLMGRSAADLVSFRLRRVDVVIAVLVAFVAPLAVLVAPGAIAGVFRQWLGIGVDHVLQACLVGVYGSVLFKHSGRRRGRSVAIVACLVSMAAFATLTIVPAVAIGFAAVAPIGVVIAIRFVWFTPSINALFVSPDNGNEHAGVVADPHRIVLLIFDELPLSALLDGTGAIDAALYPNLAEFTGTSTWFRDARTVSAATRFAVPAIFDGLLPSRSRALPTVDQHPKSLFTLLSKSYRFNVFESLTRVCPGSELSATRSGWRALIPAEFALWKGFVHPVRAENSWFGDFRLFKDTLQVGRRFLAGLQPSDDPVLDCLHVLVPHRPWHYCGDGIDYGMSKVVGVANGVPSTKAVSTRQRQRQLLQIQTADWLLGEVIAKLRDIGAFDDAMIVLMSDHGVTIESGELPRVPNERTYHDIFWVPLIVKLPGQTAPRVIDQPVRTIDVLPLIAETIGVPLPWEIDGRSPLSPQAWVPPDDQIGLVFDEDEAESTAANRAKRPTFSARQGFAKVCAARAAPPAAFDDRFRLYAVGPHADLVGRPTASLVLALKGVDGGVQQPHGPVDSNAPVQPWLFSHGTAPREAAGKSVAIVMSGRVVATAVIEPSIGGPGEFWSLLPPWEFEGATTHISAYLVDGEATERTLIPLGEHAPVSPRSASAGSLTR